MKDSDQALPNGVHATGGPKTAQKTAQEGTDTGTTPAIIPQSLPPSETVHHPPYTFNTSSTGGLPLHLATHLRQVAQKSQIRLQTDIKRSMCKRCSTVLVEGKTSRQRIENLSKGRQKAHADVLVILCGVCGAEKRFPTNARRQMRKSERLLVQST
ncbi:hypothetical protein B0A50_04349 [Salinomyces thailandicus]|uniref:RNAse P Rpr2/Rpp21 subunit domain-containing protein n=1 Tax=Salinomyces thailandicus TaxID=706561 RepID=A0A4V5N4Z1_9PEZI|nr:hypothetical protein B0A50_04349 [Salinomyces thailandica]